jgi:FemAB-related protein (PEP-CTERM system-associated)
MLLITASRSAGPTIRPVTDTAGIWKQFVAELSQSSLAHSAEWFTAIRNAYGHDPLYLTAEDGDGGFGILPAFVVRRPLFGTVVTSMPFLDAGGPCSESSAVAQMLVERLIADARAIGARTVELRCTEKLQIAARPTEHKVNLTLSLPADPDRLWHQFDKSVRNQIRKAERSGLSIEIGGAENLPAFYDTFVIRMRDLGSPVHGLEFLRAVLESFGERARIALVRKGQAAIGGLVALSFKDRLIVPWATCLQDYFSLCPNMLLYWETIRTACLEGHRRFEFGRSTRHSGTYRFKVQWGAREEPLFWYTIPIAPHRRQPRSNGGNAAVLLAKAWQRLPLLATRHLGPRFRKYLTQ